MDREQFKGKKVLVTGSSRGIGKAIVLALAAHGAEVVIHYSTRKDEAEKVLDQVLGFGVKGHILQCNLQDQFSAIRFAEDAWQLCGRIDFLINNAGVSYKKHFLDQTIEDIDYFFDINFKSTLLITQYIAKKMVSHKIEGCIYTITSVNGIQPGVGQSVYGATKGALETLMKGVALELAPHHIMVNTLAVGAIETDMNAELLKNSDRLEVVTSNIPMKRLGKPEEIASVVMALLASGSYMTGTSIKIDGGWLLKSGFSNPQLYDKPIS